MLNMVAMSQDFTTQAKTTGVNVALALGFVESEIMPPRGQRFKNI